MNNIFYSVVYHHDNGTITRSSTIMFASTIEVDHDQIRNYIIKKVKQTTAIITLHSINKLDKNKFVSLGGDPVPPFE